MPEYSLSPNAESHTTEFTLGDLVSLKSNPAVTGAVIAVAPAQPENCYTVWMDNQKKQFYASQLQPAPSPPPHSPPLSHDAFHARLSALSLRHPSLSTLYSLNAARVDFIPYQFRPVLRFIRADRPRLLIADGVGVGKTIEAGLILRELQARSEVKNVLVICPRPLVTERKWENELRRFDEHFTHLDGPTLRHCIDETDKEGEWPAQHAKTIIPYSLLDEQLLHGKGRRKGLLKLDPPPRFDLVIVDEAHHIRNPQTLASQAVRFFCDNADAAIFLTATPVQLGSNDLFVLLNTLRPDLVLDQASFQNMSAPNPFINQAAAALRSPDSDWRQQAADALSNAATTTWGRNILSKNPEFVRVRDTLQNNTSPVTDTDRVRLISEIENFHTFAGIINRTRRRDIGSFTIRDPQTLSIPFTPAQKNIHDELLRVMEQKLRHKHGDKNLLFMLSTLRRQAASCIFGLAPFLSGILARNLDDLGFEEEDEDAIEGTPNSGDIEEIKRKTERLLALAKTLPGEDPKLETLHNVIRDKQKLPNNKLMVFSTFRHTLHYLQEKLRGEFRIGLMHGGTADEERVALRERFEKQRDAADALDVMLFSEIGCEGLDYQFCDCMVNYDLPWNPMRVEQRIGRIDRNGQKSEKVAIINIITPGTVDAEIHDRCLTRIGVFKNAIGDCEEILGDITKEIKNIAENFTLTDAERSEKFQQLADNKIRLVQEQEKLEEKQREFFGLRLPKEQMEKDIEDASSFWLSPAAILRLVAFYRRKTLRESKDTAGLESEFILGEKPLKTLRLSQEARNALLADFQKLHPRQNTPPWRAWESFLKGADPHLQITFDAATAAQNPKCAFVMPLHPLVKQAASAFDEKEPVYTKLTVATPDVPPGDYEFAIYHWNYKGIRENLEFKPVTANPALAPHLEKLLKSAKDATDDGADIVISDSHREALDAAHYSRWNTARAVHQNRTHELASYQRESLATSHKARVALIESQFADDEKIRRMRQSQLDTANADFQRRNAALANAATTADIEASPVAFGVLVVKPQCE